ncbi:PREDICTED: replication protein A 70 kDa DNA-binding subunit D [Theobroma cacao]|uniref:Replication protein A 70 kDa DNA-binding subunit D n=1 Tax=Theobroma cacao TaxID=3641 RepID=A0AB32X394_THECC|nr:PREDICTED: replication protein A 70 kDa DNA-binding subunit D [Theobroma cacao]
MINILEKSEQEIMSYQPLSELQIGKEGGTIQICVARIWHSINYKQANDIISLDFLATDDKGNAIQAIIHKIHMKEFESILKEGHVYCISDFKVSKPKKSYNVISAPSAITITSKTKIVKASSSALSFQRHYFQFFEFEHLPHRYKINETLTDIIGLIISMSKVTAIYVSNKSTKVPKRNLQLQNIKFATSNYTFLTNITFL